MDACPSQLDLEKLAVGQETPPNVRSHVSNCPACQTHVADIQENQQFLARVGQWLPDAMGAPSPAPNLPELAGYDILREISRGGQGVVYQALQRSTGRTVAIKMLLAGGFASETQRHRFQREVSVVAALRHPNIVSVFESGLTRDGCPYVAMEYVDGVPLDRYVSESLGPARAGGNTNTRIDAIVRLFLDVALGVGHAHSAGIIHRDIKPSNILVDKAAQPRILDFGLARPRDGAPGVTLTSDFLGTPAYSAPEQFAGEAARIDARSDVYALGMVLHRLLTDEHAYPCDGGFAQIAQHASWTDATPISRTLESAPKDVETIILKCLAKDPARRYADARDLAADLECYLQSRPISARRDSLWYTIGCALRRHDRAAIAAAITLVVLIALAGTLWSRSSRLRSQRMEARLAAIQSARERLATDGDVAAAEQTLWAPLNRGDIARIRTLTDSHATTPPLEISAAIWALAQTYAKEPRVLSVAADAPGEARGHHAASLRFQTTKDTPEQVRVTYANGAIRAWNLETGDELGSRQAPLRAPWLVLAEGENAVFARADESLAAVWDGAAGHLRIADLQRGTESVADHLLQGTSIRHAAFSRDAAMLATTMSDGTLWLWAITDAAPRPTIQIPKPITEGVPDQSLVGPPIFCFQDAGVLASGITGRLFTWPARTKKEPEYYIRPKSVLVATSANTSRPSINERTISESGAWLAVAGEYSTLIRPQYITRSPTIVPPMLMLESGEAVRAAISSDDATLVLCDKQGRWTAFDMREVQDAWPEGFAPTERFDAPLPRARWSFGPAGAAPAIVRCSENGDRIAVLDDALRLTVWDLNHRWCTPVPVQRALDGKLAASHPRAMALSPDAKQLAVAHADPAQISVIDLSQSPPTASTSAAHTHSDLHKVASDVTFAVEGRQLLSVGLDGHLEWRDLQPPLSPLAPAKARFDPGLGPLYGLAADPAQKGAAQIVVVGEKGVAGVRAENDTLATSWIRTEHASGPVRPARGARASKGDTLAVALRKPGGWSVEAIDPQSGRTVIEVPLHNSPPSALAVSDDASILAIATRDRGLVIADFHSASILARNPLVPSPIVDLAFDPSGRWLYSAQAEPAIFIYDPATGRELARLAMPRAIGQAEGQPIDCLTPGARPLEVFSVDRKGAVMSWDIARLLQAVHSNAGANLSER